MAPIGVMSVSPVARAATIESRNVTSTARMPIHQVMPNSQWPRNTHAAPDTSVPVTNHDDGTSTWASGSSGLSAAPPKSCESPPKARTTVRHLKANDNSPEATIIAVAGQSTHETIPR